MSTPTRPAGARRLTLSGSAAETVTNLGENIVATGLTGALNVTTKTNGLSIATGAGPNTIDASLMTGALTLTGSTAATVTAHGNLIATNDSGALTVTTTGTTQTVTTGTGNISITDNSTIGLTVNTANLASASLLSLTGGGPVTVTNGTGNISIADSSTGVLTVNGGGSVAIDATALGTGTLTVAGSAAKTVNLGGSLVVNGAGVTTVNATGSATIVTTGTGNMSIVGSGSGGVMVNANATGAGKTLTLSGSAAETVTSLGENIVATGPDRRSERHDQDERFVDCGRLWLEHDQRRRHDRRADAYGSAADGGDRDRTRRQSRRDQRPRDTDGDHDRYRCDANRDHRLGQYFDCRQFGWRVDSQWRSSGRRQRPYADRRGPDQRHRSARIAPRLSTIRPAWSQSTAPLWPPAC